MIEKTEYFDICTEDGLPTGQIVERTAAHREGTLHRTAHVWIIRRSSKGEGYDILLQKRSKSKDSFPGFYDTSSAGHIPAGEEPMESALRELNEELGIAALPEQLKYAGTFRSQYERIFHESLFRDNEFTTVFVFDTPIEQFQIQETEVEEIRWFDLEEVYQEIKTRRDRICVPIQGLETLIRYLDESGM